MHTNELTFNELSASDFLPNDWGNIDLSGYDYSADEEVCFKLVVWSLQCKFGGLVEKYFQQLEYGINDTCTLNELLLFKWGLEILNDYNPRDIVTNTTNYNVMKYSIILNILQILNNKY
tara:strand:- start:1805 stop:2161 length:357 start_codon:yes stop_codon:yes gene_type:complete